MTTQARNRLLEWASERPKSHQRVLNVGLQDAIEHGEEIDLTVAEEVIKTTEYLIKKRNIK